MIDIIHQHLHKDYELVLLTGFLNPRNIPLDKSVKVHMLKSYDRSSTLKRLYSWLFFTFECWWLLIFKYRKSAIYCVSNPPFSIWFGVFFKRSIAYLIYDVYPNALVSTKLVSSNNFIVKKWKCWNKRAFSKAETIFTISGGMKELLEEYVANSKIEVVPVWTDNTFLKPIPKSENKLVRGWKLQDKFVVMYSGNLGRTHPVEVLIELGNELRSQPIEFLIIGEGEKKEALKEMIHHYGLSNVRLLPYQPTELLPYSLTVADLAVVTLANEAGQLSVPSKTFNLMSCGLPIMAIAPEDAELSHLLEKYESGRCFDEQQLVKMKQFILSLFEDEELKRSYANKSLQASNDFTPVNAEKLIFNAL
jgi:glycosyltransferase involved in cell wall biosynthesis